MACDSYWRGLSGTSGGIVVVDTDKRIAIIGAGPAGLMAAQTLAERGFGVDVYDAMPSMGRKFLMAGKSGLNITHGEDADSFLLRYMSPDDRLTGMVRTFGSRDVIAWMEDLCIGTLTGPTGRVFPSMMKASPLLRAWLYLLQEKGVRLFTRHRWTGWTPEGALSFRTPEGDRLISTAATVFAMGGGSWKRLGSDGAWAPILSERGAFITPFKPSNCGFDIAWSNRMMEEFDGAPVKNIRMSTYTEDGNVVSRAEFVITKRGVESGGIYMLSSALRAQLEDQGTATLNIDLLPDISHADLAARLHRSRGKQSRSNFLRKVTGLTRVKMALLHEFTPREVMDDTYALAAAIKSLPLFLTGTAPLDQAISTAGGVDWAALDDNLMLTALPGCFCAGEMIDWDAPTGGYLITACLATGRAAGMGVANWLSQN